MKRLLSLPALAVVFILFGSGCASFTTTDDQASLSLVGIQSVNTALFETTITLTLRVTNETNQPLRLQGSSHELALNGSAVGRGTSNVPTEVPPLGTTTIPVTIHMDNLKLLAHFGSGRRPPEIAYRLESRLFTHAGRARGLAVVTEGTFDLRPYINGVNLN
jgi:LEA14-like dessication related protein